MFNLPCHSDLFIFSYFFIFFASFNFFNRIFGAIITEAKKTTMKDVYPILMTAAKVGAVIGLLSTGNIILMGGAFWWYRSYTQRQAAAATAAAAAGGAPVVNRAN